MGLTSSQLETILSLLSDTDEEIVASVRNKLHEMGRSVTEEVATAAQPDSPSRREAERVLARFREPPVEEQFRDLAEGEADLEKGAIIIARFGYPDLHVGAITAKLDRLAADLAPNVAPDDHPVRVIRTVNTFLFDTCKFQGAFDYSRAPNPDDSYLHRVLERRRGLPIALATMYILLGRRIDVPFEGVNTPNHFLIRLPCELDDEDGPEDILLDPFNRGRILTRNECADVVGRPVTDDDLGFLPDRKILARMLANLVTAYSVRGDQKRAEHIIVLLNILNSEPT